MKKAILVKITKDDVAMTINHYSELIDAPIDEKDNLDFLYKNIGCQMIDVVYFDKFEIFVDDEGLLKSGNCVYEYSSGGFTVALAGSLIIAKGVDDEGRTLWFDEKEDIEALEETVNMLKSAEWKGMTK